MFGPTSSHHNLYRCFASDNKDTSLGNKKPGEACIAGMLAAILFGFGIHDTLDGVLALNQPAVGLQFFFSRIDLPIFPPLLEGL